MKILFVTPLFPPLRGGASTHFSNLAYALRKDQVVVLTSKAENYPAIERHANATVYRLVPYVLHRFGFIQWPIGFSVIPPSLVLLLLRHRFSVAIVHSCTMFTPISLLFLSVLRVQTLLYVADATLVNMPQRRNLLSVLTRVTMMLPGLKGISAMSKLLLASAKPLAKKAKVIIGQSTPILPPLDKDFVEHTQAEWHQRPKSGLVFVGDLVKTKGILELLEAFRFVHQSDPNQRLTIVGDGPLATECRLFLKQNGLKDAVTMLGSLPHNQTLRTIASSRILVLPSYSEGIPNVILEAFMLRTTVVATKLPMIEEVVKDDVNGILVPSSNVNALTHVLIRLVKDQKLSETLSENAFRDTEQWLTWEDYARKVRDTLSRLINSPQRKSN